MFNKNMVKGRSNWLLLMGLEKGRQKGSYPPDQNHQYGR